MPAKIIFTLIEGNLTGQQFIFESRTTCIIGRANDHNLRLPNLVQLKDCCFSEGLFFLRLNIVVEVQY